MISENQIVIKVNINPDTSHVASEALGMLKGVEKIEVLKLNRLRITYDIYNSRWATIRERLQSVGAYSEKGLLISWRDSWREMKEENKLANLRHKPACCSKPPAGAGMHSMHRKK